MLYPKGPTPPGGLPCYDTSMSSKPQRERVLLVDEDPEVLDLIARQVLEPLGYLVATAEKHADVRDALHPFCS